MTGIPMSEAAVTEPPVVPAAGALRAPRHHGASHVGGDLNVLLTNEGRLQITADVDLRGLRRLKDVLAKYDEILTLLAAPTDSFRKPEWADKAFVAGEVVPGSGTNVFRVHRLDRRGPAEIELTAGETFPACDECPDVSYTLA